MSYLKESTKNLCKIKYFSICFFQKKMYNIDMETVVRNKELNEKREFLSLVMNINKEVDLPKMLGSYIQHGKTSVYTHSRNVAYLSFKIANFMENKFKTKIDMNNLIVGAMFHDFFLYDWHDPEKCVKLLGFKHPAIASKNAQDYYNINDCERKIIETHMWPLTITKYPKSIEAKIVCIADKICSTSETIHRF